MVIKQFWRLLEIYWGTLNIFGGAFKISCGIVRFFWGSSSSDFLRILRIVWKSSSFWGSSILFLRIVILRIFWRSSSSEFSEDRHPQNFLEIVILRVFWGPAEIPLNKSYFCLKIDIFFGTCSIKKHLLSEILRILRKFWGWGSPENSEDEDPQKIPRMRIPRKFWGWGSFENYEFFRKCWGVLRKFWGFSGIDC